MLTCARLLGQFIPSLSPTVDLHWTVGSVYTVDLHSAFTLVSTTDPHTLALCPPVAESLDGTREEEVQLTQVPSEASALTSMISKTTID